MTQQELVNLIGLKITDDKFIAHFSAVDLKLPKSCTPNNNYNSVADKANQLDYYLRMGVTNEACYPPVKEGKPAKWATYLKAISLINESTIHKKADTKETCFWNLTPPPTATLAEIEAYFGKPTCVSEKNNTIYFSKKINNLVEINCQVSIQRQAMRSLYLSIVEERDLISYLYFRDLPKGASDIYGSGMSDQNAMCMLINWLHDNKQLSVGENVSLNATKQDILAFVHQQLKGKLWQNQLKNQDRQFANFIADGKTVESEKGEKLRFFHKETMLKALGKFEEYMNFKVHYEALEAAGKETGEGYWVPQEALIQSIVINAENYALFAKEMDASLAHYNQLMQLKVNREAYNFD
ncbi:MAG: hypothetical protein WBP13_06425 [Methylophilaceae bacterium]